MTQVIEPCQGCRGSGALLDRVGLRVCNECLGTGSKRAEEAQQRPDETPTTADIETWVSATGNGQARRAAFQRWLQQVKAEAFKEGVAARNRYDYPGNPYAATN